MVKPVYETAKMGSFYNGCVVGAIATILTQVPSNQFVSCCEIGAGTGSTASSVVPLLSDRCTRYLFTDVSDVFLQKAKIRFAEYPFMVFSLLNICLLYTSPSPRD